MSMTLVRHTGWLMTTFSNRVASGLAAVLSVSSATCVSHAHVRAAVNELPGSFSSKAGQAMEQQNCGMLQTSSHTLKIMAAMVLS